ncbi:MAG: hypothetical protein M3173_05640 [Chloroflexota bacterium]|nr:hypothetical protein [Chloroflexota bacterium]
MSNDIYGLVQTLNDVAERKQPSRRAHRILSGFIPNPIVRRDLGRPHPQPAIDASAPAVTAIDEARPCTLCA